MPYAAPSPAALAAADRIREDAEAAYNRIRGRAELSVDAVRIGLARAYLAAAQKMHDLESSAGADADAQRRALNLAAWSIDDLATNAVDRAAAAMSFRDAQDRAALLEQPQAALDALNQAENSGDELAARAIGQQAYTSGWTDVVDAYVRNRPKARDAVAALTELDQAALRPQIRNLWAFVLSRPLELGGLSDVGLAALAANPTLPAA